MRVDQQAVETHSRARDAAAWSRYWARGALLERLRVLHEEMQAHRDRLRAMAHAAHTHADVQRLAHEVQKAGFQVQPAAELKVRGNDLMGWIVRVTR